MLHQKPPEGRERSAKWRPPRTKSYGFNSYGLRTYVSESIGCEDRSWTLRLFFKLADLSLIV
jgi:hypothetical protein